MKMIVIGCGRVGAELAYRLYRNKNSVVVIDISETAFQNLSTEFRGRTVEGDALSQEVLRRAGVSEADGVAVVTDNDLLNAVIGQLVRNHFNVPVVVIRNYNSRWRPVLEAFNLQAVSPSSWGAQRIEELLYQQKTRTVFSLGNGEVELYEFSIVDGWSGKKLSELLPETECVAAGVTRASHALLPAGDFVLRKDDVILVSASLAGSEALRARLERGPVQAEE